ncbi:MAG TPA: MogA/MoaB family molybdenum cofactor biosynthesis protein [Candidatus Polarisedimenticolaceae bacterium]|nr:MogA/MoaB family molybdenum cofactor biosynthesis protein [Candidatus Polarisedimenticolaceae bacterium]
MTHHVHRAEGSLAFGLLTVSDTRTAADDVSGAAMRDLVAGAGHRVYATAIVRDEPDDVRRTIASWSSDPGCDAVVSSGGTGFSGRDRTVEAVAGLFERTIDGFGELFRMLSFHEVGSAAMMSRACAGIVNGTPVFVLPGSPRAVALGLSRLVLPEIGHVVRELRRTT